jgi:hypothetical protein
VVALAGCGGHTATKKDVVARGNAICTQALSAIRSVPPPTGATAGALATYLKKVGPIVEKEASQLAGLPRPAVQKQTLDAFVSAFQATAHAYRDAAAAASRGSAADARQALASLNSSKVPQLATQYGLTACTGAGGTVGS